MSCDSNDDEIKLTREYKYLLSNIRPLIDQLNKSRDAQLCLLWLSKLEQCGKWEWKYRNQILSELCKQVQENCLKPPFSSPPTNGPLQSVILGYCRVSEWNNHPFSEADVSTDPDSSSASPHSDYSMTTSNRNQSVSSPWKSGYSFSHLNTSGKIVKEDTDHSECFAIQKAYHERAQSDQMVIEKYQDIIKSLVTQQLKTDISPCKLKKMQTSYENKITELVRSVKSLQDENDFLKRKLDCATRELKKLEALKSDNDNLKQQVTILTAAKTSLEFKFKECEEEKLETFKDLMAKLNESEKKLKESEKRFKSLEKNFEENYHNCEAKYHTQKNDLEKKYAANVSALERLVEQKDSEIMDLKEQLSSQCAQFEEEVTKLKQDFFENCTIDKDKKKIRILKSKARKLEKIREHMAVLFHSQLQQIIAKKDFYIATLEMQLKMYSSEFGSTNMSSDVHGALIQKVSALEGQYRKLLEDSEKQSILRRQLDLQKIHNLEKQLLLCGGAVEDYDVTLNCLKTKSLMSVTAIGEEPKADSLP